MQAEFKLTLANYVYALVLGNLLGAVSAILGSLGDRVGRGNLIVYGLLVTAVVTLVISQVHALLFFLVLYWVLGFVEGIILTVTPALVATGLSVWGSLLRIIVVLSTLALPLVVGKGQGWGAWWWVCIVGQVVFLPTILATAGEWNPAKARAVVRAHEQAEGLSVQPNAD